MEVVLHDRAAWRAQLLPLVYTRPVGDLRLGTLTLREKWQLLLGLNVSFYTVSYLHKKYQAPSVQAEYLVIRANICPSLELAAALVNLPLGRALIKDGEWLAYRSACWQEDPSADTFIFLEYADVVECIEQLEDIFLYNANQIELDYMLLTRGKTSEVLDASNVVLGDKLFVAGNVTAYCATFNTTQGPIYVAEGAVIEEGCHLRGPISIGAKARIKMGAKLYPNVTVGPACTIGGEVNNSVFWGNSAKGHDGYLGCSVVGEWCNIGAGSSNSNLQNNWDFVSLYDYENSTFRKTASLKVGVFIGDYAMLGINSSITTGCVIGVGSQVAISNIIPKFVPDFVWWAGDKREVYNWTKFEQFWQRRFGTSEEATTTADLQLLGELFDSTKNRENLNK